MIYLNLFDTNKGVRQEDNQAYWENLRRMTPEQKINAFHALYWSARELKAVGIRYNHPELSEMQVQEKVRDIFLHAKSE